MKKAITTVVERSQLADLLRGICKTELTEFDAVKTNLFKLHRSSVMVGYFQEDSSDFESSLPSFIVIPDSEVREFYAWTATYCPFASPISQWCRVISLEDFRNESIWHIKPILRKFTSAWAGAVIGECLVNLNHVSQLESLPINAVFVNSSYVAARAYGLYGSKQSVSRSTNNFFELHSVFSGSASKLPRRELEQVWSILISLTNPYQSNLDDSIAMRMVLSSCKQIASDGYIDQQTASQISHELKGIENLSNFEKANAEQRIHIFDEASRRIIQFDKDSEKNSFLMSFIVGALAARIGGSPSAHIQLVERFIKSHPLVLVWHGLVSGLYRPELWGADFSGLGRLVVRTLKTPYRLEDPPNADISIEELFAVADKSSDQSSLGFRGETRRMLSVELIPGVNGGIRLSSTNEQLGGFVEDKYASSELADLYNLVKAASEKVALIEKSFSQATVTTTKKPIRKSRKARKKKNSSKVRDKKDRDPQQSLIKK